MIHINKKSELLLNILNLNIQILKTKQNIDKMSMINARKGDVRLAMTAKGDGHRGHRLS